MRQAIVLLVSFVTGFAMAQSVEKVYVKTIQAYGLGYAGVDFYEATVVAMLNESEVGNVLQHVRTVCSDFPRIDKYMVRVFNSDEAADPQLLKSMSNLNPNSVSPLVRKSFIAEIDPKGELTLFPFDSEKRKIINIKPNWCEQKN